MNKRLILDTKLRALLGPTVSVYFQPPNDLEIKIPACIYTFDGVNDQYADNKKFLQFERYTVKFIVPTFSEPYILNIIKTPGFSYVTMYPSGANQYTYIFRTTI